MIWALHGAVGMAADWSHIARELRSSGTEIRRLDLWRFLDCAPMPLEKFGNTLAGEISRIDPSPTLLGYSMGGRLALHALLAQPELWKGAIIISTHPGLNKENERINRRRKDAQWSTIALQGKWHHFLEQWEKQRVLEGTTEMPDRAALKTRRTSIARSFIDWSLGNQNDLTNNMDKITCPLLWLTGERDTKFTALAKKSTSNIPNATHRIIPDCGHRIPWEKPQEFSQLLQEFYKTI